MRSAVLTLSPKVGNADALEPDIADFSAKERIRGVRPQDRVAHLFGDHRELGHPDHDFPICNVLIGEVKKLAAERNQNRFLAVRTDSVCHLRAASNSLIKFLLQLRS